MKEQIIYNRTTDQAVQAHIKILLLRKGFVMKVVIQAMVRVVFKFGLLCLLCVAISNKAICQSMLFSNESISVGVRFEEIGSDSLNFFSSLTNSSNDTIWLSIDNANYINKSNKIIKIYFGWDQENPHDLIRVAALCPNAQIIIEDKIPRADVLGVYVLCNYINDRNCITRDSVSGGGHLLCGKWAEFAVSNLIVSEK
ncbi:MAG: hypothetical protein JNL02_00050 [Saprospiraceae bacterium]|nr:hypothetical protein [Saprospiraceae bacterium]